MNDYRNSADTVRTESSWTFWRFLPIVVIFFIIVGGIGFGLKSLGLIGSTIVEREVFEQSYQKRAGDAAQLSTYKAALAEVEAQLQIPGLDAQTKARLEAQATSIRVRINSERD
tara:strand:+ start:971 stop:1312 length:342 start_codon:yes stop_codon:yes gene_type:complete